MALLKYSVLFLLALSAVIAEKATYHNYQVHRVVPNTEEQLKVLKNLENNPDGLSFWIGPSRLGKHVDILVPPHMLPRFKDMLNSYNIKSEIYIKNVQELIDNERPRVRPKADFGWEDYYTLEEIYAWLDGLVEQYPVVTPILGGESYQGREIRGVKVSYKPDNPGVIIEGNIHAREWISSAIVTYMLNVLLTSTDPVIRNIAENYDFYVFPVVNPDGFVYTHTDDRMWRKTRSPGGNGCYGADPNRNFDFHWMEIGASDNPCSETYGGSEPFSEIEARSLGDYITSLESKFDIYLAFHSYSQLLLFPYGHSSEHVSNYDELLSLGNAAVDALAQNNGTSYTVGNIYNTIYPTSGVSTDWVRGIFDKRFTYSWELRDTGRYGFVLPASQIIDTAEETLNSVIVILEYAQNNPRKN